MTQTQSKASFADTTKLFEEAMKTFQDALNSGVQVQQEAIQWFTDVASKMMKPEEAQKKTQAVLNEVIPAAKKNLEETVKLLEQNSKNSLDLLKKALDAAKPGTSNSQAKVQELWEGSLSALRTNVQTILQANARAVQSWQELVK